jgi:hypothetical protein
MRQRDNCGESRACEVMRASGERGVDAGAICGFDASGRVLH